MNISVSLDYNEITFTNDILNTADVQSITLQYKLNCGTLNSGLDLTSKIIDIDDTTSSLTLNITDIDATKTVFTDGVYYFKLTVIGPLVEGEPGSHTLTGCIYIGTTSRCKAVVAYESTNNEMIKYIINALDIVNQCDDCGCSTQCDLYDYLITLITGASTSTSNVYNPCGCN